MPHAHARPSILLVEDDEHTRKLFKLALQTAGFHVVEARDGFEALHIIEVVTPKAVVLDLGLPHLSGRDVARELAARVRTRDVPIVVVTGMESADVESSVACVLQKPAAPDALVETVRKCLRDHRPARGRRQPAP